MAIQNKTLVNNRLGSLLSRVGILSIIALSALITGFISLQFFYQQKVDGYFSDLAIHTSLTDEAALIIRTKDHWITTAGQHRETYKPLLAKELGEYRNHRYVGWFSSYEDWLRSNDGLPFTLMYEVQYEHGISQEAFFFKGIVPARLMAREVNIN
ncbi:hypothetical protein [Endozoicomonas elysicola]|uniref:Uncharacterized protein n=1 Tax=Endozoicomonas elysicola TaxID=305900 RepID=A0A081KG70_9GAMM|nr:hypothetical protein [Endozoicomonas elysicola]KEI73146.1 hypothetical protein GV64_22725 [Endozoicomonas elysicola]